MIKNACLIRFLTQGLLAFILFINPAGGNTHAASPAHPKIYTEWVSTLRIKPVTSQQKNCSWNKAFVSNSYQSYQLPATSKIKSDQRQNYSRPRTLLQKTIPVGTEDELNA
ncbi:MAG: hypothetical protein KF775_07085 [Cyclobacteriaceae bacterium]|nr:hypothetical protein [Cyclobacteriaceae bacterium]